MHLACDPEEALKLTDVLDEAAENAERDRIQNLARQTVLESARSCVTSLRIARTTAGASKTVHALADWGGVGTRQAYRGTSLIRNRPISGTYGEPMPRALWMSQWDWRLIMSEVHL